MLNLSDWINRSSDLLIRSKKSFEGSSSQTILAMASKVPVEIGTGKDKIKLVFAGQYSAGKSTIVRVLTGDKTVKIGAGITTKTVSSYDWKGISIIDTPGIHTSKRPDHDAISYEAIANSDLLAFVISNELFDAHLADHFRKLAIEKDKGHEMMLVVNKMTRCQKGNTPEQQTVLIEDINRVLAPFRAEDLYISFVDAKAVIDAEDEKDKSISEKLLKKSGMTAFQEKMANFVQDKGKIGKLSSSMYVLEQVLQEAIASIFSGDQNVDGLEEILLQRRRAIVETKRNLNDEVSREAAKTASRVRDRGRRVADSVHGASNQEDINKELANAQHAVEGDADELGRDFEKIVAGQLRGMDDRLKDIAESSVAKILMKNLKDVLAKGVADGKVSAKTIQFAGQVSSATRQLGDFLIKHSFNPESSTFLGLYKLNQYSGTKVHEWVKAVGGFLGKKFRPFEAVKWTRFISKVGRHLAIAGTVLTFVIQFKEDSDVKQLECDLRDSRQAIRTGFNDAADSIEMHFDETSRKFVADTFDPEIEAIDKQLEDIRKMKRSTSENFEELHGLLVQTQGLIWELHHKG